MNKKEMLKKCTKKKLVTLLSLLQVDKRKAMTMIDGKMVDEGGRHDKRRQKDNCIKI